MREERGEIRARLAAALDEADAIENRPIEEVRAALADQGIDPTASIKLARKLAHGSAADDPSARLLQQIERSETVDAEIAALEEAGIEDVKAALPPGTGRSHRSHHASSEQAEAKVVPIQPRRRLSILGWGGSLIGIAASVLLFVAVRPDRLDRPDRLQQAEAPRVLAPAATDAESADALSEESSQRAESPLEGRSHELSQSLGRTFAGRERYAAGQADLAETLEEAPVARAGSRAVQSLDEKVREPFVERRERVLAEETELDRSSGGTALKTKQLRSPPLPAPRPDVEGGRSAETAIVTSRLASLPMTVTDVLNLQEQQPAPPVLSALLADLKAILLVDEVRTPSSLRLLSNRLPEGRLASKLGEAERRASGGKVIALVAFERDGAIVEAALVETPSIQTVPDPSAQTITDFAGFAEGEPAVLLGSEASFELIELSAGR